jgi:hypothetical protein
LRGSRHAHRTTRHGVRAWPNRLSGSR